MEREKIDKILSEEPENPVKEFLEIDISEDDLKYIDTKLSETKLNDTKSSDTKLKDLKNVHFINWKQNEHIFNRDKNLKISILEKLAINMLEGNNESVIDLRKCDFDEDFLKCLKSKIKDYDIYGIIWKDENKFKDSDSFKRIEDWIQKNNQEYRRYPSDYIYCLLASHCRFEFNVEVRNLFQESGWMIEEKFRRTASNISDYYSVLYKNNSTRQMVLAYRGLKLEVKDLFDDMGNVNNTIYEKIGNQMNIFMQIAYLDTKKAFELSRKKKYSLSFTGYLFGAWLAEQSVFFCYKDLNTLSVRAVTFESPGSFKILNALSKSDYLKKESDNFNEIMKTLDIKTYLFSPNFINTSGVHLGKVYRLIDPNKATDKIKVLEQFILKKIINEIKVDSIKQVVATWFADTLKPNLHIYFFYLNGLRSLFSDDLLWILALFDKKSGSLKREHLEVVLWPELKFKARGTHFDTMLIKNALEIKRSLGYHMAEEIEFNTLYGIRWMTRKALESLSAILVIVAEMSKGNLKNINIHDFLKYGQDIWEHPKKELVLYDESTYKILYEAHFEIKKANLLTDSLKNDPMHPDKLLREFYFDIDPKYKNGQLSKEFDSLKKQFKITEEWNGKNFLGSIISYVLWVDVIREIFLRYYKVNEAYKNKIKHEEVTTKIEDIIENIELEKEIKKCFEDIDNILNTEDNSNTIEEDSDNELETDSADDSADDVSVLISDSAIPSNPIIVPGEEENIPDIFKGDKSDNFIKTDEHVFQKIDDILDKNHYAYIIGASGYGKSTLAREYGYYKKDTINIACIQFIVSHSLSKNLVELKFRFIKDNKIQTCEIRPEEMICMIKNRLDSLKKEFIFILDNVENISDIKLILDTLTNQRFLITTQKRSLFEKEDKSLKFGLTIKGFDERCCFEYMNLNGLTPTGEEKENWKKLIKDCKANDGCISPKTFELAIQTHINQGPLRFDQLKKLLLNKEEEIYSKVKNEDTAIEILNHLSFLDGNSIELPLIKKIFINNLDNDFDTAMMYLIENAFLKETKEKDQVIYKIHESTQIDLRKMLDAGKQNDILTKLVFVLNQSIESDVSVKDISKVEEVKKIDDHTKKIIEFEWENKTEDMNYVNLIMKATKYNEKVINYEDSIKLMTVVSDIEKKKLEPTDPKKISTLHYLGLNYFKQGNYEEALKNYNEAVLLLENNNLKKHPNYAASLSNIGLVYINQEKYDLAWTYYDIAIKIFKENEDHEFTSKAYFNMGCINQHKKNFEKAMNDYNNALTSRKKMRAIKRKRTPEENKMILLEEANVVNNMASCYSSMKKYEKARELFIKAYKIRLLVLPDKHSELAKSLNNIGCANVYLKHFNTAKTYFKNSILMRREIHPPNHPDIACSLFNMGDAYYQKKDYKTSLELLKKALRIYKNSLPSNHPNIEQTAHLINTVEKAAKKN